MGAIFSFADHLASPVEVAHQDILEEGRTSRAVYFDVLVSHKSALWWRARDEGEEWEGWLEHILSMDACADILYEFTTLYMRCVSMTFFLWGTLLSEGCVSIWCV